MEGAMKAVLMGIAVGGFAAAVVDANIIAAKALWRFNCLAAEKVWVMAKATAEWAAQAEDDDDSEPNEY